MIQNGSFESFNTPINWNNWGGGFFDTSVFPFQRILNNWEQVNSPDCFLSACTHTYSGSPINVFGNCLGIHGGNYAGFYLFSGTTSEVKEYIYQQLNSPLTVGKTYRLSFYVSLAEISKGAIKNIGAYFSNNLPSSSSGYINVTPQIENQSGFVTDTINWVKIDGVFTAIGGEQYITIGNFNSNANTDTLTTATNYTTSMNVPPNYAYYYIDSITLLEQTTVGLNELNISSNFAVFPNPNNGTMQLDYDLGKGSKAIMELNDVAGKLIKVYKLETTKGMLQLNEQSLHNGIYFYRILVRDKVVKTDKIVIIK